jgi:hypothetical protein
MNQMNQVQAFKIHFNPISRYVQMFSKSPFRSLFCPPPASCPFHLILHDSITLKLTPKCSFSKEYLNFTCFTLQEALHIRYKHKPLIALWKTKLR